MVAVVVSSAANKSSCVALESGEVGVLRSSFKWRCFGYFWMKGPAYMVGEITRISDSIQFSTSCIKSVGFLPIDEIVGPIEIVIKPGFLMKEFFGQHSPELTAIGTTTEPVSTANRAPPPLYLP